MTAVACSRRAPGRFLCEGDFHEPEISARLEVDLDLNRNGFYLPQGCRITRLGPEAGSRFACQHLTWDLGHMVAMLETMAAEAGRRR